MYVCMYVMWSVRYGHRLHNGKGRANHQPGSSPYRGMVVWRCAKAPALEQLSWSAAGPALSRARCIRPPRRVELQEDVPRRDLPSLPISTVYSMSRQADNVIVGWLAHAVERAVFVCLVSLADPYSASACQIHASKPHTLGPNGTYTLSSGETLCARPRSATTSTQSPCAIRQPSWWWWCACNTVQEADACAVRSRRRCMHRVSVEGAGQTRAEIGEQCACHRNSTTPTSTVTQLSVLGLVVATRPASGRLTRIVPLPLVPACGWRRRAYL
jgi:hypothetical protein